jgi:GNAT superfamily N-acetyltransferase
MIRIGSPDDAAALQQACYRGASVEMIREWLEPAEEADRVLLVATDDADVAIGNCTLTRRAHRMERHRAEIGGFVISPVHRGTGVARQLVDACVDYARTIWGSETLELGVRGGTHAEDAYRWLGFVEWARMPSGLRDRDGIYDDVRLYRRIDL